MKDLKTMLDICFFRARPQDVSFSYALLAFTAVTSVVTYIVALEAVIGALQTADNEIAKILEQNVAIAPLAVAEHVFFALTVWLILIWRSRPERFVQALTSMFGTNTLAQILTWALAGWLVAAQDTSNMPAMLIIAVRFWLLLVFAQIFRHTLETRFGMGVLYTLGSWIFTSLLLKLTSNLSI